MFSGNKWIGRAFVARALYTWWQSKRIQEENAGRFLDDRERRSLLSSANTGLLLDGDRLRLSDDDSFRNLALIATTGAGKTSSFILPRGTPTRRSSMACWLAGASRSTTAIPTPTSAPASCTA